MSATITVRLHLRKAWDQHFLAGATPTDRVVKRIMRACWRENIVAVSEFRRDYPAPGLSGVLVTRMPKDVKTFRGANGSNPRLAGL